MRWRAPRAGSSPHITAAGFAALQREFAQLWVRRDQTTAALAAAAAEGDRSENAEYIYRKKELRELDRRIRYLQKRLPGLVVVRAVGDRRRVFFGARVRLADAAGAVCSYRIVGADELAPASGAISADSPVARALLGRALGERVELPGESGPRAVVIESIDYRESLGD